MYRIFISHAWLDRYYVKRFVDEILHLGCGVEPGEVFMSSAGDKGIPDGENLNTFVLKRIAADNTLVIAMLTPAYFTRPFCTAELGAAWSRAGSLFPLALPGMNPKSFKGVLDGQIVSHVDEGEALDRLSGRVGEVVGAPVPPERWNPHRKAWLDELDQHLELVAILDEPVSSAACSVGQGHMEVFWADRAARVFHRRWNGEGWDGPWHIEDVEAKHITAVGAGGTMMLFGVNREGEVWTRSWVPAGDGSLVPGPTKGLAGLADGPLAAVARGPEVELAAWSRRSREQRHRWLEGDGWSEWSPEW